MNASEQPDLKWVIVSAGTCLIGADVAAHTQVRLVETPATYVELPDFVISRTPITNAQYAIFVVATGYRAPAHWEGDLPPPEIGQHPVTYVDWFDARAFCTWAGVRLPSEAEWEKAARGNDERLYPWGDSPPNPLLANSDGRFGTTTTVGNFPHGASPYGALDMAGNVWEWTASSYRAYPYRIDDQREDTAVPGPRVLRGGSFNHTAADLRCAARDPLYADACDEYIGFRVAADHIHTPTALAFDWVIVPAGTFRMGTDAIQTNSLWTHSLPYPQLPALGTPRHMVALPTFALSQTPVTNAQYAAFVAATGYRAPAHWQDSIPPPEIGQHPVTYVDWYAASSFCEWVGGRLPNEAEWEKAAGGIDERTFPWGDDPPDQTLAWFNQPADALGTRPVGERLAGASMYGALDMAGNVWEWTASLHWPYPFRNTDGRDDPMRLGQRVLRGGSFRSTHPRYLHCAFRSRSYPTRRRDHIGFRVARNI